MHIWPHSVHSFNAASSFCSRMSLMTKTSFWTDASLISASAATAFAITIGLRSESMSCRMVMSPLSMAMPGFKSNSFATHKAAVLRTYGSSSF